MARGRLQSWGLQSAESELIRPGGRFAPLPRHEGSLLPFGNGRSYGDACLNPGGGALLARGLDHFISFDAESGVLACEAGVLLDDILKLCVPKGWFLPVTPGTRFVTLGGAIANDVHGKNHHAAGSFGCHVRRLELLRSGGRRLLCGRDENEGWFAATIGGLGLTGLITSAEIQLMPVAGPWMMVEAVPFSSLEGYAAAAGEAGEYSLAWLDCTRGGVARAEGIFFRARHAADPAPSAYRPLRVSVPFTPPFSLVGGLSSAAVNALYRRGNSGVRYQHYMPFFYPLDSVGQWNRVYGRAGFYQYQCVVPAAAGLAPVSEMLAEVDKSGGYSFISTLKNFGGRASPGMLSFPLEGAAFAIDLANRGAETLQLMARLDSIVRAAGGRLYPAKDARMPGALFRAGYPRWKEFSEYIDPQFSSGFWRRVMEDA